MAVPWERGSETPSCCQMVTSCLVSASEQAMAFSQKVISNRTLAQCLAMAFCPTMVYRYELASCQLYS